MKKKLALIDSDSFIFLAGYHYKDTMTPLAVLAAQEKMDILIRSIKKVVKADCYLGFVGNPVTSSNNYRFDVATIKPYKGTRKPVEWVDYFKVPLKQHLIDKWGYYPIDLMEADDACAIAFNQYKDEYDIIFVFIDKDLNQVTRYLKPGEFMHNYNFNKYHKGFHKYSYYDGVKHFWISLLTGDTADNISGVKGVGKKSPYVFEINQMEKPTEEELFELVRDVYIEKYEDDALDVMVENYILLNMLNKPQFDYPKDVKIRDIDRKDKFEVIDIADI